LTCDAKAAPSSGRLFRFWPANPCCFGFDAAAIVSLRRDAPCGK
jgi:hypothetical protein